jgi:hypothetical protein
LVDGGGAFIGCHLGRPVSGRERCLVSGPGVDPLEHRREIASGEPPVERGCGLVVAILETAEPVSQSVEVGEIGWLDDLALDDREHDLDLVEPRGVDRQMHEPGCRPRLVHPIDGSLPVVGRPVVDHPVHPPG